MQFRFALLPLIFLAACTVTPVPPVVIPPVSVIPPAAPFAVSKWEMLPDWQKMDLQPSWTAFLQTCHALKNKPEWQIVCARANELVQPDNEALRLFFEDAFTPYQVYNPDGTDHGLITGYYEPRLSGSRAKTARFKYPLYAAPEDLLTIDLTEVYPQLKDLRLRGRLEGRRIVPYFSRSQIDEGRGALHVLFWVENAVDLFFLQIQGSGRIELADGSMVKVGYADQNGHPYVSIGKKLIEMGELKADQASMQGIKHWAEQNPAKLSVLLAQNPSFVFFRELPVSLSAPLGALGVPLTDQYSIAIDPRTIPLGFPVFLSTTYPNTAEPLNRLMLAQDTGGAIRGAVRADFFWGFGDQAGAQAGRMKQSGQMWVLFPKGAEPVLN
ncbi:MAG: MltA domain-containing protein [Proteobacteria bacterium]|nr:MltA domain-containing protein [Pseudomonadota bacterium]